MPAYWLMKSEPDAFSWEMLKSRGKKGEPWSGVRNFQARNYLREMKKGDLVFFYHSSCEVPGIAGVAAVQREAYPDPTQFDPKSDHYDAQSDPENPRWYMVDVKLVRKLDRVIPLDELRVGAELVRRYTR